MTDSLLLSTLGSAAGVALSYAVLSSFSQAQLDQQEFNAVLPEDSTPTSSENNQTDIDVDPGTSTARNVLTGVAILGAGWLAAKYTLPLLRHFRNINFLFFRNQRFKKQTCHCCGLESQQRKSTTGTQKCAFCSHVQNVNGKGVPELNVQHAATPPTCCNGHSMMQSRSQAHNDLEWFCDCCNKTGSERTTRWCCIQCHSDVCFECKPPCASTNHIRSDSESKRQVELESDTNMFAVRPISSEDQSCTNQVYLFVQQVSPNKLDLSHVMGTFSTYVLPKYATQHGLSSERRWEILSALPDTSQKMQWFRYVCRRRQKLLLANRTMFNGKWWKMHLNRVPDSNGSGDTQLMEQSFNQISGKTKTRNGESCPWELWRPFEIVMLNQGVHTGGQDLGGVRREWFEVVGRELFSCKHGLFKETHVNGEHRLFINEDSGICNEDHLLYFRFAGRMIAMSIIHNTTMPACLLCDYIWKLMGGNGKVGFHDIATLDKDLYTFLKQIQEMDKDDVESCHLEFKYTSTSLGRDIEILLDENQEESLLVTNKNRDAFVTKWTKHAMIGRCENQLLALLSGVFETIPQHLLTVLSSKQIQNLVCGENGPIDVEDWKKHTEYRPLQAQQSQVVQWYWELVSEMNETDKSDLLRFATASSTVNAGGFGNMLNRRGARTKFKLQIKGNNISQRAEDCELPTSHTCFMMLELPNYKTKKALKHGLQICIKNNEGFGLM